MTFIEAFCAANDDWQDEWVWLRSVYASGYFYEYLPNHGGMSSSDPVPYLSGGYVLIHDHWCE